MIPDIEWTSIDRILDCFSRLLNAVVEFIEFDEFYDFLLSKKSAYKWHFDELVEIFQSTCGIWVFEKFEFLEVDFYRFEFFISVGYVFIQKVGCEQKKYSK